jgi:uncharacterized membrane protein HdeD (DUF308 family)
MLAALALMWAWLVLRVTIAGLFGIAVVAWPGITLTTLVRLFGLYALIDGVLALIVAVGAKGQRGFGSLLLDAIVRLGLSGAALTTPPLTVMAMNRLLGTCTVLTGLAAIAAALALRHEMTGAWPLPVAGTMTGLLRTASPWSRSSTRPSICSTALATLPMWRC